MAFRRAEWERRLVKLLLSGVRFVPRGGIRALGRGLGRCAYHLDKKHRRIAQSNLATALGGGSLTPELKRTARHAFRHFGVAFMDMFHFARQSPEKRDRLVTMEGDEHIRTALEGGRGALLISAHFGLWEIAPALISRLGRLNVVARPLDNPLIETELMELRESLGESVIPKHQASRRILRALRENQMVAILMDQNVLRREAVFVDFFGRSAATTPAPAAFHLLTEAPLIPVFCVPSSPRHYHIEIHPPLTVPLSGEKERDIQIITQACTRIIEDQIRRHPELWFWFHDRWKSRPAP